MRNIFVVKQRKDSLPEPRLVRFYQHWQVLGLGIECFTSLRYAKHSTPDPDFNSMF